MTMRPGHRHGWAALTGAALSAFLAAAVPASTPTTVPAGANAARARPAAPESRPSVAAPSAPGPVAVAPAPGSIGLMAFLDPDTGLLTGPIGSLVPPADPRIATPLLTPVALPGGGWMLDLRGTGQEYYVLHVDPLGRRSVTCVEDPRAARAPAPAPAAASAARER